MLGEVLADRYLLTERIGAGGMGAVYRATDLRTGGTVAVKLLHPLYAARADALARLRREAEAAAVITSPRVVRVIDLTMHGDTPLLVMEYVPGESLAGRLARTGRLPVPEALSIMAEVARALDAAHAAGVTHRDLKPDNIKLVDGQVKVLDFGIARLDGGVPLTASGEYIGTPAYSAPERLDGPGDIRADIYALGVMLYELLEGHPPFEGEGLALLMRHVRDPVPPLTPPVPPLLAALLARCLAKAPVDRFQTPAELVLAFAELLDEQHAGSRSGQSDVAAALSDADTVRLPEPAPATPGPLGEAITVRHVVPGSSGSRTPAARATTTWGNTGAAPTTGLPAPPASALPGPPALSRRRATLLLVSGGAAVVAGGLGAWAWSAGRGAGTEGDTVRGTPTGTPGTASPPTAGTSPPAVRTLVAAGPSATAPSATTTPAGGVRVLAGSVAGFVDGPAASALFAEPTAVAIDARGAIAITDKRNHAVRVLDPSGTVRTLAGGGQGYADGSGREARFAEPLGIAATADGTVYVADAANHRIRRIGPDGTVTTLAGSGANRRTDGQGTDAAFYYPLSLALTPRGDLLVVDYANDAIRLVTTDGRVTTLAGGNLSGFQDGSGGAARFDSPSGIAVDRAGIAYVADEHNHRIRRISPDGNVTTLAGAGTPGSEDGPGAAARFNQPKAIAVSDTGVLYITDYGSGALRRISPDGLVTTIRLAAPLESAHGLALAPDGALIVAETGKDRILSIPPGLLT